MAARKSSHVTLQDVAKASGVSVSTVSIVLSEAPLSQYVAAATRERVRNAAKQLGYHPDAFARSLRRRKSQTIAVMAFDLSDPFCTPIVRGIQEQIQPENYLPLVMDAQNQRKLFDKYLMMALERRAEGLVVVANWFFEESNLLSDVEKNLVPVIIVGRDLTERKISSVLVDNEAGGALAMRHLYEMGHRNIAVIRGPKKMFDSEPRWVGARAFAKEAGMTIDPKLVLELPESAMERNGFEGGVEFAGRLLATGKPFSAVLAFDDLTALGVVRGLSHAGKSVPGDYSVIGFDDVLPASTSTPGITTIHQPLEEMGARAAEWALKLIQDPEAAKEVKVERMAPTLVVRESVQRYKQTGKKKVDSE